jgi:hypothetical protein
MIFDGDACDVTIAQCLAIIQTPIETSCNGVPTGGIVVHCRSTTIPFAN